MGRRSFALAASVYLTIAIFVAAGTPREESKTGWITDTKCGLQKCGPGHKECADECVSKGAKYVLCTEGKALYALEPQEKVRQYAGQKVTVKGTIKDKTIKVTSVEAAATQE